MIQTMMMTSGLGLTDREWFLLIIGMVVYAVLFVVTVQNSRRKMVAMHEKIRTLSMEAGRAVKEEGRDNNLLELIAEDPAFPQTREELEAAMQPERYVGRAPRQVEKYLEEVVKPLLSAYTEELGMTAEISV